MGALLVILTFLASYVVGSPSLIKRGSGYYNVTPGGGSMLDNGTSFLDPRVRYELISLYSWRWLRRTAQREYHRQICPSRT